MSITSVIMIITMTRKIVIVGKVYIVNKKPGPKELLKSSHIVTKYMTFFSMSILIFIHKSVIQ